MSDNKDIGSIDCPICTKPAHVRKFKQRRKLDDNTDRQTRYAGKLYIFCPNGCGRLTPEDQEIILNRATLFGPTEPAPVAPVETPAQVTDDPIAAPPIPAPTPEPEPTKEPLRDRMNKWLL